MIGDAPSMMTKAAAIRAPGAAERIGAAAALAVAAAVLGAALSFAEPLRTALSVAAAVGEGRVGAVSLTFLQPAPAAPASTVAEQPPAPQTKRIQTASPITPQDAPAAKGQTEPERLTEPQPPVKTAAARPIEPAPDSAAARRAARTKPAPPEPAPEAPAEIPEAPAEIPEAPAETPPVEPTRTQTAARAAAPQETQGEARKASTPAQDAAPARVASAPVLVTDPRFRSPPTPPVYPPTSRRRHEEGIVVLRALVSPSGRTEEVAVHRSSGFRRLDEAARLAVLDWRFEPARRAAVPVASWVEVPVRFHLN